MHPLGTRVTKCDDHCIGAHQQFECLNVVRVWMIPVMILLGVGLLDSQRAARGYSSLSTRVCVVAFFY